MPDGSMGGINEKEFYPIEFRVASQGAQSDVPGGQVLEAVNEARFNQIWATLPSMTGEKPILDFEKNQAVVILSQIVVCSSIEITDVSENAHTTLVTVTEVVEIEPGLCDPRPNTGELRKYAVVEFEYNGLPVSVLYQKRNDY